MSLPSLGPLPSHLSSPRRQGILSVTLEEFVIWAYRDQKVEQMTNAALEDIERAADDEAFKTAMSEGSTGYGVDSAERLRRRADFGTDIDGGGRSIACHPDAELLHDEVCVITKTWRGDGGLIKRFGKSGDPPEWRTAQPKPVAVPVEEGVRGRYQHKLALQWYEAFGQRPKVGRGESVEELEEVAPAVWHYGVRFCPLVYTPPEDYVQAIRKEYADWHRAMGRLMDRVVKLRFGDHRVTGFAAPMEPWSAACP